MTDKQIIINGVDVSGCKKYEHEIVRCNATLKNMCFCGGRCTDEKNANCYFKQLKRKEQECKKLKQTLAEIKDISEPYKMTIKKICGNCKKYDDCNVCCYKDINCYKYTRAETNACEEFVYLDEFVPNILANNILQKISEVIPNEN